MGSMAQDERHERILESCRERVHACAAEVARLESELKVAQDSLRQAKASLADQERIDLERD